MTAAYTSQSSAQTWDPCSNDVSASAYGYYNCTPLNRTKHGFRPAILMASEIPNLNSLRTGRRGPRLRGRADGRHRVIDGDDVARGDWSLEAMRDRIIQQTDGDANSSRMSAVSLNYLEDRYASLFNTSASEPPRRYPLINRGTYVRTKAIDQLVLRFLNISHGGRKQIVSLGAGSDTRYFRLCANDQDVVYHEIDFEDNVNRKRDVLRKSPELSRMAAPHDDGPSYHLYALDLRDLTRKSPPQIPGLEADLPTLLISECCLCYLPPEEASSVVQYFAMQCNGPLALVLYEPIRPFDAFGKTMVSNLGSRGIELRTLKRYYSLEAQRQRLRIAGFINQGARDVYQLWEADDWVSKAERERIDKLEWLDEVEEWQLLASHYCVAWGWKGEQFDAAWKDIEGQAGPNEQQDMDPVS